MTRVDHIIHLFHEYEKLADKLAISDEDKQEAKRLRMNVGTLIPVLKRYGCRRDTNYDPKRIS